MDYTNPPDVKKEENPANMKFPGVVSSKKVKRSLTDRFLDLFVEKDISKIKNYATEKVIKPKIRSIIVDIICYLFGTTPNTVENIKSVVDSVSYDQMYTGTANVSPTATMLGSFPNLKYKTESDATLVLIKMREIISKYGLITINNWYDISQQEAGANYQLFCNYGWRDLSTATVYQSGGWWYLQLPKAQPIK